MKDLTTALAVAGLIYKQSDVTEVRIIRNNVEDDPNPFVVRLPGPIPMNDFTVIVKMAIQQECLLYLLGSEVTIV